MPSETSVYSGEINGAILQKALIFILAAVRTWNLTTVKLVYRKFCLATAILRATPHLTYRGEQCIVVQAAAFCASDWLMDVASTKSGGASEKRRILQKLVEECSWLDTKLDEWLAAV
jgi:hypothetical protein